MFVAVWSYNRHQHRDENIQADLNKLYDTRPPSSDKHQEAAANGGGGVNGGQTGDAAAGAGDSAPYFDLSNSGDVTAVLHKTAILNCRVKSIGNKTVTLRVLNAS